MSPAITFLSYFHLHRFFKPASLFSTVIMKTFTSSFWTLFYFSSRAEDEWMWEKWNMKLKWQCQPSPYHIPLTRRPFIKFIYFFLYRICVLNPNCFLRICMAFKRWHTHSRIVVIVDKLCIIKNEFKLCRGWKCEIIIL